MTTDPILLPGSPPFELWLVRLADASGEDDAQVLDEHERSRAARLRFERDRRRYVASHVALRQVLARRTGIPAASLRFELGENGKPRLAGEPRCAFSLSHSDERALVALADRGEIGVDIERVRVLNDLDALAQRILTAAELERLEAVPADERTAAFLRAWTRKEACLKALGIGLLIEPSRFAVDGPSGETSVAIPTPAGARTVLVQDVALEAGWVGAVARVFERH